MRRAIIVGALALSLLSVTPSHAATAKPAAKPTAKAAAKPTAKPSTHKAVVHHYYYRPRPRIGVAPSPAAQWPPQGFTPSPSKSVYARVPSGQELLGILSASQSPSQAVNECAPDPKNPSLQAVGCGAVLAASATGCSWWEVTSDLRGPDPANSTNIIMLGSLRTLSAGTAAHSVSAIILVSGVPLVNGLKFANIQVICHPDRTTESVPSDNFTPAPGVDFIPAPSPSATPAPSPTPSASNS